jgi:hypothetical protein
MRRYSLGLGWIDDLPAGGNTPHPGTGWLPAGGKAGPVPHFADS